MISFANTNNEQLKKLVDTFLEKSGFSSNREVMLLTEENKNFKTDNSNIDVYVIPYEMKDEIQGETMTYSLNNNNANVVLINIQNHPESKSFEIMTDSKMGRVFINQKNNVSVENVLMCAALFMALEMDLSDILNVLNGILK